MEEGQKDFFKELGIERQPVPLKARQVTIPPLTHIIMEIENLKAPGADGTDRKLDGWLIPSKQALLLEKELIPEVKALTALHEIMHGVLDAAGQLDSNTEGVVNALSNGLLNVRIDDKPLIDLEELGLI